MQYFLAEPTVDIDDQQIEVLVPICVEDGVTLTEAQIAEAAAVFWKYGDQTDEPEFTGAEVLFDGEGNLPESFKRTEAGLLTYDDGDFLIFPSTLKAISEAEYSVLAKHILPLIIPTQG